MSCQLKSILFSPRGPEGWTTGTLTFGQTINLLMGPNGSGKTPAMKGLPFALGFPIEFPPEIKNRCRSVTLNLLNGTSEYSIEREIGGGFEAQISTDGEAPLRFNNEKDFSAWLAGMLGLPKRTFASKDGGLTPPYASSFVPMFWIDQDIGWKALYAPLITHNFVKDQSLEMLRWFLGVPSLNRAVDKSDYAKAKEQLEIAREQAAVRRAALEGLAKELGHDASQGRREALATERDGVLANLKTQASVLDTMTQTDTTHDEEIARTTRDRDAATFALNSANTRLKELDRLGQELEAEVQVLETNEVAADAFRQLCGNQACQFFRNPEESYGRRLLFLKDQLKDFRSSRSSLLEQLSQLQDDVAEADRRLASATQLKKQRLSNTISSNIVSAVDALSKSLSEVNLRLERLGRLDSEQKRFNDAVTKVLSAEEEVNRLKPKRGGGTDNSRLMEVRGEMTRQFIAWLAVLNAENIPQPVIFDEELNLILGKEKFTENSSTSGSTRTRVVLAFHAAILEASLRLQGAHPRFLIMDTPKQNELHTDDLKRYVERVQAMSDRYGLPLQLFISATEESFASSTELYAIERFRPTFTVSGKPRFFGTPAEANGTS
jgi:hypothetical protein